MTEPLYCPACGIEVCGCYCSDEERSKGSFCEVDGIVHSDGKCPYDRNYSDAQDRDQDSSLTHKS